ncbi:MAG: DUF5041 domain-containing protein [Candidatus Aminicenantes bacterium]|nr:DUF5041 domain-containing protein [Candidatus Aminicenantes bacterium]MDH5467549.1 DUF5041 domain-containing protein [Candidatus Aminicenantes bacterium]MDH5705012.1 DUF5041 domain-containing protein [Candidatus Aminicenantes bacterium]
MAEFDWLKSSKFKEKINNRVKSNARKYAILDVRQQLKGFLMKAGRLSFVFLIVALLGTANSYSQFNKDFKDITHEDVIEALQFAGIDIFKFSVNSFNKNYDFYVFVDEFTQTGGLKRVDTLLAHETEFRQYSDDKIFVTKHINYFRFLTKVLNNTYDTIHLYISTNHVSTWKELHIAKEFSRKHYWVRFSQQETEVNKTIPLLFYGSEWDEIIDGKKVPRFCSRNELKPELADPTIKLIPHYFIISYRFQERQ